MKNYIALVALLPVAALAGTQKIDPREAHCLATTIYGEAGGESMRGQIAVAFTVVNRASSSTGKSICKVVLEPKQYSIYNDNPALQAAAMSPNIAPRQGTALDIISWKQANYLAVSILRKEVPDITHGATHYYSPALCKALHYPTPAWAKTFKLTAVVGDHRFYRP